METYLFYTTHLVMIACVAGVISAGWPGNIQASVKKMLDLQKSISFLKKLKAVYHSSIKQSNGFKLLLVNILNIVMQVSAQLMR